MESLYQNQIKLGKQIDGGGGGEKKNSILKKCISELNSRFTSKK